jgi:hypothetical protein
LHHVITQQACLYSGLMAQSELLRQLFRQGRLDDRKFGLLARIPKAKYYRFIDDSPRYVSNGGLRLAEDRYAPVPIHWGKRGE